MGAQEIFANTLSMITIISCMFMKVPQIMHIRKTRRTDGLNPHAMSMEIFGFTTTILYNYIKGYSVLTYLEYPIILIQIYVLVFHVLKIRKKLSNPIVLLLSLVYVATIVGFVFRMLSDDILSWALPMCTPLSGIAKITYIYGIFMAGNADAVSLTTWVISIATNLARVFTVYVDSGDIKLMANFGISSILSTAVLVTAILFKWQSEPMPSSHDPRDLPRSRRRSKTTHFD